MGLHVGCGLAAPPQLRKVLAKELAGGHPRVAFGRRKRFDWGLRSGLGCQLVDVGSAVVRPETLQTRRPARTNGEKLANGPYGAWVGSLGMRGPG